ncbi:MAG: 50S ribosomal protein L6 [bacterium]|nr:MAG: 50S ribosomal protein L6 [bacterium]
MSRVGKKPIPIPKEVKVEVKPGGIEVSGPKGTLNHAIREPITARVGDGIITVERPDDSNVNRALHGLTRALISNMVEGVSKGFEKKLIINGVGYRASLQGKKLVLLVGYSHPVELEPPAEITFDINKQQNEITVKGISKELVGQMAANIRNVKKPEPYKGKGIRYENEVIRRKAGKSVAAGK